MCVEILALIVQSEGFAEEHIKFGPFKERRRAAIKNFPKQFSKISILLDGTHTEVEFSEKSAKFLYKDLPDEKRNTVVGPLVEKNYYSFKTGKCSYLNTQVYLVFILLTKLGGY